MVTTKDIMKFIAQQEVYHDKQFANYQETGYSKYYCQCRRAEKLIDIARLALNASDEHQIYVSMRVDFLQKCRQAQQLYDNRDYEDPEKMRQFIYELSMTGRGYEHI